jgi:hypothetical protein
MDPQAAYQRWLDSTGIEAIEAFNDLLDWLSKGGFEPEWKDQSDRDMFMDAERISQEDDIGV